MTATSSSALATVMPTMEDNTKSRSAAVTIRGEHGECIANGRQKQPETVRWSGWCMKRSVCVYTVFNHQLKPKSMIAEKRYLFKHRLSQKSSFVRIAEAVRALGYELKTEKRGVTITWETPFVSDPTKTMFHSQGLIDERVPEWLNEQLEEHGLLKTQQSEI